jgi:hypothetical protein
VVSTDGASVIADQRAAWSCAQENSFSERRPDTEASEHSEELPGVFRSRMAMSPASIADAPRMYDDAAAQR